MIQKILVTFVIISLFLFILRILKNFNTNKKTKNNQNDKEKIIDLEKDPKTDEYKPKE